MDVISLFSTHIRKVMKTLHFEVRCSSLPPPLPADLMNLDLKGC